MKYQWAVWFWGGVWTWVLIGCGLMAPSSRADAAEYREQDGRRPGKKADGSVLLPNQWSLRPVGRQVLVGDFPVQIAMHPRGQHAAVLHCGYGPHEIVILDITQGAVVSRASVEEAFYGLVFSSDGAALYCSGAGKEWVYRFQFEDGYLSRRQVLPLRDPSVRGIPSGLAVTRDGQTLFVANLLSHQISRLALGTNTSPIDIPLGTNALVLVASPGGQGPVDEDTAAITKRALALLDPTRESDPFPYACVLDEARRRLYVSLWAHASVAVVDVETSKVITRWPVQDHPNEMLLGHSGNELFVANANHNTVSVLDTRSGRLVETLTAELTPNARPGSTPNSLALTQDGRRLFVANANINAVAVFDVSQPGRSRSVGFIPVGWYPTSLRLTPDNKRLLVANGKGVIPKANRHGPQPAREILSNIREYIGGLFQGTVSIIDLPEEGRFEAVMKSHTAQAYRCPPPPSNRESTPQRPAGHPVPLRIGDRTPIQYCIYIIKENRTYDQVLGDLPQGNGDSSLCLFPEAITPNHHALAREFVLLDNFYVESEVSADGHEWSVGAYATDFVEKTWPLSYGHNQHNKYTYPAEGRFRIAEPAGGYLWDRARAAGVTYRSYGEFINNGKTPQDPGTTRVAALDGHFDPWFRGFDMDYPDVERAERFLSELQRFEREGDMPRLQILRLPNDHTSGTTAGKRTPTACVADNDLAFGMVIQGITRSRFWPKTAIFVVEDDAQNGPDHVDAHRTIAYVISPYARRGKVDSTMYSTSSMLRTIELILGLEPMSQFDAVAIPMDASFQVKRDLRPYRLRPVTADRSERNVSTAWGSDLSKTMDFAKEDAADDLLLNEVIWRSVKGAHHPMPAPTRAAFVFSHSEAED